MFEATYPGTSFPQMNVAVAQFGPGKGDGLTGKDDFGRMRETGRPEDRYAFRTPALRNIELTAPYGHDGAFFDLREFIAHDGP
jgi:cytochrome c peroxidase